MDLQILNDRVRELQNELEDIKAKLEEASQTGRWKPKFGEFYYSINMDGKVIETVWDDHFWNEARCAIGNCFKTKEEAEFEAERLKVLAEMREFEESPNREWNEDPHYFILYNTRKGKIGISYVFTIKDNNIFFESEEKAQECIASIGEERIKKYYIGIKEDQKYAY